MTDILFNSDQEIQLALLGNIGEIDTDFIAPSEHVFNNAESFPSVAEWSKYNISDSDYLFDGIDLESNQKSHVTVTMAEARSGFKNILGKYSVDDQGIMRGVGVLVHNTREVQSGDKYSFFQDGKNENIQFFLIANGQSYNKSLQDSQHPKGSFKFITNLGAEDERLAKITDDPAMIELVYQVEDKITKVEGNIYHTTDSALNSDSKSHSISGVVDGNENTLRISFEDFPNLGDRDFNDVVFDVNISYGANGFDQAQSLNDISPAEGKEGSTNQNIYEDGDILDIPFSNSNRPLPNANNNGIFVEEEIASEVTDTLILLDQLLKENSLLDHDIANYIEKTIVDSAVENEQKIVSVETNVINFSNDINIIDTQHTDYLI